MALSEKIKNLRKDRNWSQQTVANKLEISLNSYGAIERGETNLTLSRIEDIARVFEVDLIFLFDNKISQSESLLRRKQDLCRRADDGVSVDVYKTMEIEKLKLEQLLERQKLEEVITRQHAILLEKSRHIEFLEHSLAHFLSSVKK